MAKNVIGHIPSKRKNRKSIVFSAHYDHLGRMGSETYFPGANDNASGTAAAMEIAEAFMIAKREGFGPKRSVLIMAVSGEENSNVVKVIL